MLDKEKRLEANAFGSLNPSGWGWFPLEMCLGQRCAHSSTLSPVLSLLLCWVGASYDCPEVSDQGQGHREITDRHMNRTEPATCRKVGFIFLCPLACPFIIILCPLLMHLYLIFSRIPLFSPPLLHHLLLSLFSPLAVTALVTGHDLKCLFTLCSQTTIHLEKTAAKKESIPAFIVINKSSCLHVNSYNRI